MNLSYYINEFIPSIVASFFYFNLQDCSTPKKEKNIQDWFDLKCQ